MVGSILSLFFRLSYSCPEAAAFFESVRLMYFIPLPRGEFSFFGSLWSGLDFSDRCGPVWIFRAVGLKIKSEGVWV